jgi:hypothetical protein
MNLMRKQAVTDVALAGLYRSLELLLTRRQGG